MSNYHVKQHHRVLLLSTVIFCLASVSIWQQTTAMKSISDVSKLEIGSSWFTLCAVVLVSLVTAMIAWRNSSSDVRHSEELAFTDELTGLPNRRSFYQRLNEELARAARHRKSVAVLYFDLDRFKEINDCYGHDAGDKAIIEFGERVNSVLRTEDMLARMGGDEFAAVVTEVNSGDDIERIAERILSKVRKPFEVGKNRFYASASIGAAIIRDNETSSEEALRRADMALLQAKRDGRSRLQVFDPVMESKIRDKRGLESDLREAVTDEQLTIEYQPMICQSTYEITGVEALVRWKHPQRGNVSPGDFIPLAEETGLIHELGEQVLTNACRDLKDMPDLKLAVNISPIQFRHGDFIQNLKRIIDETGFPPERLELEITEGTFITNPAKTAQTIREIRELGIKVALDDFGTGYSSMAYLHQFALDRIKIDRSFVQKVTESPEALQLISTMIDLGTALGLNVTIEGIETSGQLQRIKDGDNTDLQGFLFSRPITLQQLRHSLACPETVVEIQGKRAAAAA
jgi:diguanylate cyclase (GGDEF)-like protein